MLKLPEPIVSYLAAERARDHQALIACFADDAVVHDEGRDYRGRDAILIWRKDVEAKYRYDVEPLDASIKGNRVTLFVRLSGDFPGSPVEVDFDFTLTNDKIDSLVIQ